MSPMPAPLTLLKHAAVAAVALALPLVLGGTASADIYHYVDADGVVHFTSTAP